MIVNSKSKFIILGLLGAIVTLLAVSSWSSQRPIQAQGSDADGDGVIDGSPLEERSDIPRSSSSGLGSGTLIGVAFDFTDSPVVSIDEATGAGALIGLSGFSQLNSLARNSSGTFFSAEDAPGTSQDLITINSNNGMGASVAVLNFGDVTPDVRGLAFSSSDILFALNNTGPAGGLNPDDLYTIDVGTGLGTPIGATGLTDVQGLTFSPLGTLFGWDITIGLVTIDPGTGLATDVNPLVNGTIDIQGIAFAQNGILFGAGNSLYEINPATGEFFLVGSNGYSDVRGIEEIPIAEEEILSFSVKFVCGYQSNDAAEAGSTVRPGMYATEINIHNYKNVDVPIMKFIIPLVINGEPVGREPSVTGIEAEDAVVLPPNTATMDDCFRIGELLYGSPPTPFPLTIGYLEITSPEDLNVDAVYTVSESGRSSFSAGLNDEVANFDTFIGSQVTTIDVERIEGKVK